MLNKIKALLSNLKNSLAQKANKVALKITNLLIEANNMVNMIFTYLKMIAKVAIVVGILAYGSLVVFEKLTYDPLKKVNQDSSLLDQKYTGPSHENSSELNRPLIRVVAKDSDGKDVAICSAVVISDHYALTAGHCLWDDNGELEKNEYTVYNDEAQEITKAKAASYGTRPDLGLLRGDFSMFNQVPVVSHSTFFGQLSGQFVACGYPAGAKKPFCDQVQFSHISSFDIAGSGVVIPGMSGGALFDPITGKLVGIITAGWADGANVHSSLLIGFDAALGIEE